MTDKVRVQPGELRGVAGDLTAVSGRVRQVLSGLRSAADGEGAPWGNDKIGNQFANGSGGDSPGYVGARDKLYEVVDSKVKVLEQFSTGLRDAAKAMEQQDTHSARGYK
ncbi:WXG100 family type VII secretion target [Nocardia brasiliensis]|uniref:WXG100 family type VII secretion target n=1 Tax=Nocardia brasiliensis TaxID=37326 RepID=UPI003672F5FB